MDIQEQIQLGENKFVDAVNIDTSMKISLNNDNVISLEYNIQNILDVTEIFDVERQDTDIYRLHGEIEYFSILNGILKNYKTLEDFFSLQSISADTKNILSDFKFYVVKPSTGFTELIVDEKYIKNYDVIGLVDNVEIVNAGFATNIFAEQQHAFVFNIDIDLTGIRDGLNFPITEIAIYAVYQPQVNGNSVSETMERKSYDSNGNTVITSFTPTTLNIGDVIVGDVIDYDKILFSQSNNNLQEYYIYTQYSGGGSKTLKWKYDPIIPITLRVFEDDLQTANSGSTSFDDVSTIPDYATAIDGDGNFVWKNLLDKGFFDPITNVGVNFPFINQKNYIFKNIIVGVKPDLTHANTGLVFSQIKFGGNTLLKSKPNSSLDNIGKLCT